MPAIARPGTAPVRLADVAAAAGASTDAPDVLVTGVTLDSRVVLPGDLYAALPGHVTHGARFVDSALAAGASAILTDPVGAAMIEEAATVIVVDAARSRLGAVASLVYGHPARALQILGVTGTNGKTTVATMVESGLRESGRRTGLIGTIGVQIAGESYSGARTTPEATDLHAILAAMREHEVDSVVMEVSSIALEEHRVDAVVYDVASFTNLTQDHLDYHGSMEAYFAAKVRLFTPEHARLGIVGIDDEWGRRLVDESSVPMETWSLLDPHATWRARRTADGLVLDGPDGLSQAVEVRMPGAFNVANAVCAFAMLVRAGVEPAAAAAGIGSVEVRGRMQVVQGSGSLVGIVDYAHSPDAVERVLRAARDDYRGRLIVVVGAGGDRDRSKRPLMGQTAARLADVVIVSDDNPRSEDPAQIRAAVLEGARSSTPAGLAEIHEQGDREAAIRLAVSMAQAGDVVLVLGKGHEQGQEAAGVVTPFDDATVLRTALEGAR
jgi:UDP-N-acetylmuramoyl-L-alanyl-D-glutamate--2,6-diaminopimelate ligase